MKIEHLSWDSDFFNRRIARLDVTPKDSPSDIFHLIEQERRDYDLIYIFSPQILPNFVDSNDSCKLVDERVVYSCVPKEDCSTLSNEIYACEHTPLTPELERLAWISAGHSRYKIDNRFGDEYKRLYTRWIENSLNLTFADKVFCHRTNETYDGLVTLNLCDNIATIGLIAVDDTVQEKGIGTQLFMAVQKWSRLQGATILNVATQLNNIQACRFYEKQGMVVSQKTYIYHFWTEIHT